MDPTNLSEQVSIEHRANGSIVVSAATALGPVARCVTDLFRHWEENTPDNIWIAERPGRPPCEEPWRSLTYGEAGPLARNIGEGLLRYTATQDKPILAFADNSVDFGLLILAAIEAGIPITPTATAYALKAADFSRVNYLLEQLQPGIVYVEDGEQYATALAAWPLDGIQVIVGKNPTGDDQVTLEQLTAIPAASAVKAANAQLDGDSIAKIMFTSGSTGKPKGVITTHYMLCSNQTASFQVVPAPTDRRVVHLCWLPWSHTAGGNASFNGILYNGGTLYIDQGKPTPRLFEQTVINLRELSPTFFSGVPASFELLVSHLEKERELAKKFFADLDYLYYASAALPANIWRRLEELSQKYRGEPVPMYSGWGLTETAPTSTRVYWKTSEAGRIGLPIPGTQVKLAPFGGKLELRVKGANVTPGYWRQPDKTAESFDEEGFFKTGDAGRFYDLEHPEQGLALDGRVVENFKLTSGTWVQVGELRLAAIAAADPIISDAVITGHDRNEIGMLVFPNIKACREIAGPAFTEADDHVVLSSDAVRNELRTKMQTYNASAGGSSKRITRAMFMAEPPSFEKGETTEKGYLNQQIIRDLRADSIIALYDDNEQTIVCG